MPGGSGSTGCRCHLERVHTAGVERAVLVQAIAAHGYDCSYLLSNARPGVAARRCRRSVRPRPGRRPRHPCRCRDRRAAAVLDPVAPTLARRRCRPSTRGECVERRVRPSVCVLPNEISALVELASAFPDTEFAVDHVAFAADDEQLAVLAAQVNLCPTVTATSPVSVDTAMRWFGTDRLSWGSDHPQHGPSTRPPST